MNEQVHLSEPGAESYRALIQGGMSPDALSNPPQRGEWRTYVIKAKCIEHRYKTVNDADRLVCVMEHEWIYEQGKVPIVDEHANQPQLDYESGADGEYSEEFGTGKPVDAGAPDLPDSELIEQRADGRGPKLFSAAES